MTIDKIKESMDSADKDMSDKDIYLRLYAEKKWKVGQFKLYRRMMNKCDTCFNPWIDTHESVTGERDEKEADWMNFWSGFAADYTTDQLIGYIKREQMSEVRSK